MCCDVWGYCTFFICNYMILQISMSLGGFYRFFSGVYQFSRMAPLIQSFSLPSYGYHGQWLTAHGVLPMSASYPRCSSTCNLRENDYQWCTTSAKRIHKTTCYQKFTFTTSHFKDTFLDRVHLQAWRLVLYVNHWLHKVWDHNTIITCLHISLCTSFDWRSFWSEVKSVLVRQSTINSLLGVLAKLLSLVRDRSGNKSIIVAIISIRFGTLEASSETPRSSMSLHLNPFVPNYC